MKLLNRFLHYVSFDTQSDPDSTTVPSTAKQLILLHALAIELQEIGASEVELNPNGYLTATIPATKGCEDEPVIGFFAHVDTSPDAPGANIKPQLIHTETDTIVTTDGTTLLGADDKAGVAEIMTAAEQLLKHPDTPHGRIRIAFTTDEEVGSGVDNFDVKAFGADFAYTMDGGTEGEFEYENFNAAEAAIIITGKSAHPGDAKGKMLNAMRVAMELDGMLPADERPETTEGRRGFYHMTRLTGKTESAEIEYIIRDHDRTLFEGRKIKIATAVADLNKKYGDGTVTATITDTYYNMREVLERHPNVVERAEKAMRRAGVMPIVKPIRGGTDGARLSYMGLPCPNIFTGGENFHSRNERIALSTMRKAVRTIVEIARLPMP